MLTYPICRYKRIHAVIVRGTYFSPSAVKCVASYLKISLNNVVMGVPDTKFAFPFAKINGCRLVVQNPKAAVRNESISHFKNVIRKFHYNDAVISQEIGKPNQSNTDKV